MTIFERYDAACIEFSDIYLHLPTLRQAVIDMDAQTVVEIGVGGHGRSTVAFLVGVEATGGKVWSCDILGLQGADWLLDFPRWTFVEGDSLTLVDQAPAADLLFIDSEHTYEQTFAELQAFVPKVRPGGRVYLHDTGPHKPGVAQAINEYCEQQGWSWVDTPECYGLGRIDIPA